MSFSTLTLSFLWLAPMGCAQQASSDPDVVLYDKWPNTAVITVKTTSFPAGELIPDQYSAYGNGISPQLSWTGVPPGTVTLFVAVEDPDAPGNAPFVHWLVANVPPKMTEVPEANGNDVARPALFQGGVLGRNGQGGLGYFGPKPPAGDSPHHYHFEVFALDKSLDLPEGFDRTDAVRAMEGHVIGKGRVVGTYRRA
jgi:Raf kinase inhibitor-like YbhB/YbcL family protein